jgi:hypothetical protein
MIYFFLVSLAIGAASLKCPAIKCDALDEGVCATLENGKAILSEKGCPGKTSCTINSVWPNLTKYHKDLKVQCKKDSNSDSRNLEELDSPMVLKILSSPDQKVRMLSTTDDLDIQNTETTQMSYSEWLQVKNSMNTLISSNTDPTLAAKYEKQMMIYQMILLDSWISTKSITAQEKLALNIEIGKYQSNTHQDLYAEKDKLSYSDWVEFRDSTRDIIDTKSTPEEATGNHKLLITYENLLLQTWKDTEKITSEQLQELEKDINDYHAGKEDTSTSEEPKKDENPDAVDVKDKLVEEQPKVDDADGEDNSSNEADTKIEDKLVEEEPKEDGISTPLNETEVIEIKDVKDVKKLSYPEWVIYRDTTLHIVQTNSEPEEAAEYEKMLMTHQVLLLDTWKSTNSISPEQQLEIEKNIKEYENRTHENLSLEEIYANLNNTSNANDTKTDNPKVPTNDSDVTIVEEDPKSDQDNFLEEKPKNGSNIEKPKNDSNIEKPKNDTTKEEEEDIKILNPTIDYISEHFIDFIERGSITDVEDLIGSTSQDMSIYYKNRKIYCKDFQRKSMKSGSSLKECDDISDCVLKDGSKTECLCGFDGKAYCQPHMFDSMFEIFYKDCDKVGLDIEEFHTWMMSYMFYIPALTRNSCTEKLFKDMNEAADAVESLSIKDTDNKDQDEVDSQENLLIAVSLVFAALAF